MFKFDAVTDGGGEEGKDEVSWFMSELEKLDVKVPKSFQVPSSVRRPRSSVVPSIHPSVCPFTLDCTHFSIKSLTIWRKEREKPVEQQATAAPLSEPLEEIPQQNPFISITNISNPIFDYAITFSSPFSFQLPFPIFLLLLLLLFVFVLA